MSFGIEVGLLDLLKREGGYTNNPSDSGGETNHGITIKVARANGYMGDMKALPVSTALAIYRKQYYTDPGFDEVFKLNPEIAGELFDTGVNMGTSVAAGFLLTALNALNRGGRDYPDIEILTVYRVGNLTLKALAAYLKKRGDEGVHVLLKALNVLQGARYLYLAEHSPKNEDFVYGWLNNRITL